MLLEGHAAKGVVPEWTRLTETTVDPVYVTVALPGDAERESVRRVGRWVVPRRLELRLSWCDMWLDFTDAVIIHDTLRIDLNMRGGSLVLVTRPGVVTDGDSLRVLRVRYADVKIRPGAEPGVPAGKNHLRPPPISTVRPLRLRSSKN